MGFRLSATLRNTRSSDIITFAGASAKIKFYNGTAPATGAAVTTQTLLATLTGGAVLGTTTGGVLTLGAVTQSNASHVTGTPTWVRIEKSDATFVADLDIGAGAGNMQFTGSVTTGVDVVMGTSTITEGNA